VPVNQLECACCVARQKKEAAKLMLRRFFLKASAGQARFRYINAF
jgi:hypothetical protein